MTALNTVDYRAYLRGILEERTRFNPRYGLRAFARDLRISAPRLSDILKGKKGLSQKSGTLIAQRLCLNTSEQKYFCDLIAVSDARSKTSRLEAEKRLSFEHDTSTYRQLSEDEFQVIAQWYHLAVVELVSIGSGDIASMAKRLGIAPIQVEQALDRLERLNILTKNERGTWRKAVAGVSTTRDQPSDAIRSHHRQMLEKSLAALARQDISQRDFSTITVAFSKRVLPAAKQLIETFKKDFLRLAESAPEQNEVYALGIQLFALTETNPSTKERVQP